MSIVLVLNLLPLSHTNAVFYYAGDDAANLENKGGPMRVENDPIINSGLSVSPSYAVDTRQVFMDGESASALASSNPVSDVTVLGGGLKQYKARKGDTIVKIAKKFNISEDTIKFANRGIRSVRAGETLTILPVSGVLYAVKEGDALELIAKKYGAETDTIKRYNPNYQKILAEGKGTMILPSVKPSSKTMSAQELSKLPEFKNFFMLPLAGLNFGQLHDNNAVDIGNKCGTSVKAAASGMVIEDAALKTDGSSGWNDGYGLFVLIEHANGVKTRYAHLNKVSVKVGDSVNQGDKIGLVGNTGNTDGPTGCHLHFEVVGAKNPFATK